MSTRLIVLGLLHEGPLHGYEIKRIMKERYMDEWANVAFGSIYFALKQMAQEGLILTESTEQNGNRPSRTVFAITLAGRREFLKLLRESWQSAKWPPEIMRVCLVFIEALPPEEIMEYLCHQIEFLDRRIEHIKTVGKELSKTGAPWIAEYIWQYDIDLCRRSLKFLYTLREDIRSQGLTWASLSRT